MFRNVVVGIDEHEGARDAIALAKNLLAWNGELSLVHVLAHDGRTYRGAGAAYEAFSLQRAAEVLEQAREQASLDARIRWRVSGSVGRGLHELCESIEADLLVIGSSRRGLIGRVLMRDDARAALTGAPCAIALAPPGYSRQSVALHEIGVGWDGSPESNHALDLACLLAAETGAKLSAFEVLAMPVSAYGAPKQVLTDAVEAGLSEARETISKLGDIEPHATFGDPAEELALYSASLDLLVVGSRGYGPIGRLFHGSTSERLARLARCPLLVLPRSATRLDSGDAHDGDREASRRNRPARPGRRQDQGKARPHRRDEAPVPHHGRHRRLADRVRRQGG